MTKNDYTEFFEKVWSKNKAKGLAAQIHLENEFKVGKLKKHADKLFSGCWLLSPRSPDSHKHRMCFFIHDVLLKDVPDELDPKQMLGEKSRPFYAIAEYMNTAGIGVVYAIASADNGSLDFKSFASRDYSFLKWNLFFYEKERLHRKTEEELFGKWGGRGRPTYRKDEWNDDNLKKTFNSMTQQQLDALILNELFYTGYLKSILKKSANDPYDVDSFIISLSQKHILPVELKEKFPVLKKNDRYFGIDAGRIMMLLRVCIPNDSNALYMIREMSEDGKKVNGWKFMPLSKIVMSASWNLQAGGRGMGGSDTQTVRLPYDEFEDITENTFEEENLKKISSLPKDVKDVVANYKKSFKEKFG